MSKGVAVVGLSGTGKSTSIGKIESIEHIGLNPKETLLVNVQNKPLPFDYANDYKRCKTTLNQGLDRFEISKPGNMLCSNNAKEIIDYLRQATTIQNPDGSWKFNVGVIDDFQYIMSHKFMQKSAVKGYEKFSEIAADGYFVLTTGLELRDDFIFIILTHSEKETNPDGSSYYKMKTIGKMLDEKVSLDGLFVTMLFSDFIKNDETNELDPVFYTNRTANFQLAKSPIGMFPEKIIPNDLGLVVRKIKEFYKIA